MVDDNAWSACTCTSLMNPKASMYFKFHFIVSKSRSDKVNAFNAKLTHRIRSD